MGSVEERVGKNEALFREVNERIAELNETFAGETLEVLCECADRGCTARIELAVDDYRRVRSVEATFVVLPGHVLPQVEEVVLAGDGFVFVRKHGEAAEAARAAG